MHSEWESRYDAVAVDEMQVEALIAAGATRAPEHFSRGSEEGVPLTHRLQVTMT